MRFRSFAPRLHPLPLALGLGLLLAFYDAPAQAQLSSPLPASGTPQSEDAQASELTAIRQQMAELQKRLEALENAQRAKAASGSSMTAPVPSAPTPTPPTSAPPTPARPTGNSTPAPPVTAPSKQAVTISGLLQAQSLNYLHEDINNGGNPSNDTFRLRRGELRVTAPTITRIVSGTIMFDVAKFTSGSGTNTNIRARDNILQDLQLTVRLNQNKRGANFIDFGQYKIPIGYESLVLGSGALPFTERSLIFTQRDPFDGGYGDVRDAGVQIRGNYSQLEYRAGIFNGLGDRQNALSLSDQKALLAWLGYRPRFVPGLLVGISGGKGNTGVQTVVGNTTVTTRDDRKLFNAFLAYNKRKFSLQGEYIRGSAAPIIVANGSIAGRNIQGYYIGGGYYITPKLELVARYDYLDTNRSLRDADVNDILAGFNYYIKDNNAKVQINIVKRNGGDDAPTNTNPITNLRNDRLELRSGVQVAF